MNEEIQQAFKDAPPSLQNYLVGSEFDNDIQSLALGLKLPPESFVPIKNYMLMTLLDLLEIEDLKDVLPEVLSLDEKTSNSVVDSMNALTLSILERILDEGNSTDVKELSLADKTTGQDLRASLLPNKKETPKEIKPETKTFLGSRAMLMEQLSLIGQIPKDEDVFMRLAKIKEQLKKGEEQRAKLDAEIKAREEKEKYKRALMPTKTVPRRVYDIDPYREQVDEEDDMLS